MEDNVKKQTFRIIYISHPVCYLYFAVYCLAQFTPRFLTLAENIKPSISLHNLFKKKYSLICILGDKEATISSFNQLRLPIIVS